MARNPFNGLLTAPEEFADGAPESAILSGWNLLVSDSIRMCARVALPIGLLRQYCGQTPIETIGDQSEQTPSAARPDAWGINALLRRAVHGAPIGGVARHVVVTNHHAKIHPLGVFEKRRCEL